MIQGEGEVKNSLVLWEHKVLGFTLASYRKRKVMSDLQEGEAGSRRDHLGVSKGQSLKVEVIQCGEFILQLEGGVASGDSWVSWVGFSQLDTS